MSRKFVAFLFRRPGLKPRPKLPQNKGLLAPEVTSVFELYFWDMILARFA